VKIWCPVCFPIYHLALVVKALALVRDDCIAAAWTAACCEGEMRLVTESAMNFTVDGQVTDNVGLSFEYTGIAASRAE
jgi:hypothetical protein